MGSKEIKLNQRLSNIVHIFFDSNIENVDIAKLKKIEVNPDINKDFVLVNSEDIKELNKIYKNRNKTKIILLPKNIDDIEEEEEEEVEDEEEILSEEFNKDNISSYDKKYVSIQRKAFIKWLNEDFYNNIIQETKSNKLKIYQNFVKEYLSFKSPYRGLLVYHGLGTGKTATAISTAEGLSNNMDITTLLPASLETEFIKEVKVWGEDLFRKNSNNWKFIPFDDIISQPKLRKLLYNKYKVTTDIINKVHNKVKEYEKGFWDIAGEDEEIENIKNVDGFLIKKNVKTETKVQVLTETELKYIDIQNTELIKVKYNFIHYNPFPKVKDTGIKEFMDGDDDDIVYDFEGDIDYKTNNQQIVKKLEEKLKINKEKYYINSPFNDEVIIIDEVHNFIREIVNNSGPSRIFYNWIINARNIKLICLSGTPIINKPSEVAVLFNMIKGITKTYNFIINVNDNNVEVYNKLKEIFYNKTSPIYQINVTNKQGRLCVSIMKNTTRFESVMDKDSKVVYTVKYNDYDFKEFINIVYDGLHKLFKPDKIIPSQETFESLPEEDIINIIKGGYDSSGSKKIKFDDKGKTEFCVHRELFTINNDNVNTDLTNNNEFMNYFFDDANTIPTEKKSLLKRMIMGLVSYYPIDRSSIVSMPEVINPKNIVYQGVNYSDFKISKKIQVELCPMSQRQFDKYEAAWLTEKERTIKMNRSKMYSSDTFDYHIRTRQACNMVYDNDKFRLLKKDKDKTKFLEEKEKEYSSLAEDDGLSIQKTNLKKYSPKFNRLLENLFKYVDDGKSVGKALFYSEFRGDAGSEIFELILQSNGYTKYNPNDTDKSKKLRYTFITGSESQDERRLNKVAFNDIENKFGEYIQVMIISGAGAEGISLTCVRQVHILEPYWNYVRIDQVFGRAIRLESHDTLDPKDRTVEEYLYLSAFPEGESLIDIYKGLKDSDIWDIPEIEHSNDKELKELLTTEYKTTYDLLNNLVKIKTESLQNTLDQNLFNIMEKKYVISQEVTDLIKEASVDCIQNTRDDISINKNCLEFDELLQDETAYFPGVSSERLNEIDIKQLESKINVYLPPDIFVVSALQEDKQVFLYTKLNKNEKENNKDIRYIKENGKLIGIFDIELGIYQKFMLDGHELDKKMGTKLSVFQELYTIDHIILDNIRDSLRVDETDIPFPPLSKLLKENNLIGYKVKYNITEDFFYMPIESETNRILKIFPYSISEELEFSDINLDPIFIVNKNLYVLDNEDSN